MDLAFIKYPDGKQMEKNFSQFCKEKGISKTDKRLVQFLGRPSRFRPVPGSLETIWLENEIAFVEYMVQFHKHTPFLDCECKDGKNTAVLYDDVKQEYYYAICWHRISEIAYMYAGFLYENETKGD